MTTEIILSTGVITDIIIPIIDLPSISASPDMLIYTAGGGSLFPSLPIDYIMEPGLYHGANPLLTDVIQFESYESLDVSVTEQDVFSAKTENGLFDIEYPSITSGTVDGQINYIWDDIYTTPLGIYTESSSTSMWNFNINNEIVLISTNDVNTIPKVNDYIVFNYVPTLFTAYVNGSLPQRLPYFKGTECYYAMITDVLLVSGTGASTLYQLKLDKSFHFATTERYAITLLNRSDTSIQKELFYNTFRQIEVNKQQLLGDPYNNTTNFALPFGRMNYLNYGGHEALGMRNLLSGIINQDVTPFMIFDANDDIKDRISFNGNTYDVYKKPIDVHFEFHLPYVMMNDNLYSLIGGLSDPIDILGNVIENIFVTNSDPLSIINDINVGRYGGLYLKNDSSFVTRYGWVFFDLRIVVLDEPELVTAMSYNSNRNYTLPKPIFQSGSGNSAINPGIGLHLNVVNATNTSPIVITTSTPYGLPRGAQVVVSGVEGNTAANGEWYVDSVYLAPNIYQFELWSVLPTYVGSTRVVGTGTPSVGNGVFVNNGIGNSGIVQGAQPAYSYFYTYRLRNLRNNSTLPYGAVTGFNYTVSGSIDNSNGSLFVNIPKFNWYNQQTELLPYDLGFEMMTSLMDAGYGIDIVVGKYVTDPTNINNPTAITGVQDVVAIPLTNLFTPFSGDPTIGFMFQLNKIIDYDAAVASVTPDYSYDLLVNMPLYTYTATTLSSTLLTGNCKWTIGNFIFRNHVQMNRATFSIKVGANEWNNSTNPTYTPTTNSFITNKYISEVAVIMDPEVAGVNDLAPMIYAKIAPAIQKNNELDLVLKLNIDF